MRRTDEPCGGEAVSRRPAAVLLDIDGVLVVGDRPVPGAIQALDWIRETGISFRCVTNGTRRSRATIAARLADFGFPTEPKDIFSPAIAAVRRIRGVGADSCHLVSTGDVHLDLLNGGCRLVDSDTPFVVVGDAAENWTYGAMNRAFRLLLDGACLIALERDRYWREQDGLSLGAGPFVAGLEYAAGCAAEVLGKPSPAFFRLALDDLDRASGPILMIGDDPVADIGGARGAGCAGWLVRTGKYRDGDAIPAAAVPDRVIDSIADLPAILE